MAQSETWLIIGAFIVRLGVPLTITVLVTWFLHRLDRHWRNEAAAHRQDQATSRAAVGGRAEAKAEPCWQVKGCAPEQRARCAAHAQPSVACWLVFLRRDGRLPSQCRSCPVFNSSGPLVGVGAGAD